MVLLMLYLAQSADLSSWIFIFYGLISFSGFFLLLIPLSKKVKRFLKLTITIVKLSKDLKIAEFLRIESVILPDT